MNFLINITKFFPVSKWKHSRNKVKTDYWVRDANLNYESKITNIAGIANAVQCHTLSLGHWMQMSKVSPSGIDMTRG